MNPHELIQKGIKYNDMDLVKQGYDMLNQGEHSSPPVEKIEQVTLKETPQDHIIEEDTPGPSKHDEFSFQIRQNKPEDNREREDGGTYTRSEPINTDKIGAFNLFNDDLTEEVQHTKKAIQERSGGKSLYGRKTAKRNRQFKMVRVKCNTCDKKYEVHPIHARKIDGEVRFTCDKCVKNKGKSNRNLDMPRM